MDSFHRRQSRVTGVTKPAPKIEPRAADTRGNQRVDRLLVQQGLASSRTAAQRMIEAGRVSWAGGLIHKPAFELPADTVLIVQPDETDRFVSRGAFKLRGALAQSGIVVKGKTCLDVGQSTGGFTDCLLQAGAAQVVGVDVGHSQLHERLRADPRITALEGVNCRNLSPADLGAAFPAMGFDLIVADVSFISLTLILPNLPPLLAANGQMLLLVKPQFEVGPTNLGKGGIVKEACLYIEVEHKIRTAAAAVKLKVLDWFDSPITGTDGNREFFIWTEHEHTES